MKHRIIKFRGWNQSLKKMFIPDTEKNGCELSNGEITRTPDLFFMQFTGLLDNTKKEIFEGDILLIEYATTPQTRMLIVEFKSSSAGQGFNVRPTGNYKIIGNIYENPEMVIKD